MLLMLIQVWVYTWFTLPTVCRVTLSSTTLHVLNSIGVRLSPRLCIILKRFIVIICFITTSGLAVSKRNIEGVYSTLLDEFQQVDQHTGWSNLVVSVTPGGTYSTNPLNMYYISFQCRYTIFGWKHVMRKTS